MTTGQLPKFDPNRYISSLALQLWQHVSDMQWIPGEGPVTHIFGRLGVINCHSNPGKGRTVVITTISEDFTVLFFLFFGGYYKFLLMSGGDPLLGLPVTWYWSIYESHVQHGYCSGEGLCQVLSEIIMVLGNDLYSLLYYHGILNR